MIRHMSKGIGRGNGDPATTVLATFFCETRKAAFWSGGGNKVLRFGGYLMHVAGFTKYLAGMD